MDLRQLRRLVQETVREESSRKKSNNTNKFSRQRRERRLIEAALSALDKIDEGIQVSSDPAIATMSEQELGEKIGEYVSAKKLQQLVEFLNAAAMNNGERLTKVLNDNGPEDQAWSWKGAGDTAKVSELYPTQGTIDLGKSLGYMLSMDPSGGGIAWEIANPNTAYGDGREDPLATTLLGGKRLILDGHHRWSAIHLKKGKAHQVAVATLTIPGAESDIDGLIKSQLGIAHAAAQNHNSDFVKRGIPFADGDDEDTDKNENRWRLGAMLNEGDDMDPNSGSEAEVGSGKTTYGEILKTEGSVDVASYHVDSLGKTSHDSKAIIGNNGWWKVLCKNSGGDQAKAFGWLRNYPPVPDEVWSTVCDQVSAFPDNAEACAATEEIRAVWNAMGQAFARNWDSPNRSANPSIKREVMPQYAGSKDSYEIDLEQDTIAVNTTNPANYSAPYTGNLAAGHTRKGNTLSESISLERWHKLAGIKKD